MSIKWYVLPIIVIAQFCCTSLWFAGNAVIDDLASSFGFREGGIAHLTSSVQFGFIIGTLVFAFLTISDRYSPSKVFFVCAILGALYNLGIVYQGNTFKIIFLLRIFTGFSLAGIYPVGMKIAADYYNKGLGKSLGFLVGALVLGTALPHLIKAYALEFRWEWVIYVTSSLATLGGLLIVLVVPDGPYRKASQKVDLSAFTKVFKEQQFRGAAFGYFGHMWELYTFWAFVPLILKTYSELHGDLDTNISLLSFFIIGIGSLSCAIAGIISLEHGAKKVASIALSFSGICCIISPFAFLHLGFSSFLIFLLFWGIVVIADSAMFSTLVARHAPSEYKGTALTIVNCIGFAITIISLQFILFLMNYIDPIWLFIALFLGPVFGMISLFKSKTTSLA